MWMSEDFKSFLSFLAAIFVVGLLREIIKHIFRAFPIIDITIGVTLYVVFLIVAIGKLIQVYFQTKVWIYLAIAIAMAILPILWIFSKVKHKKETDKLNDH